MEKDDFKRIPMLPELRVRDIETSKKFYLELGWKIYNERPEDKFMLLQMEELHLMIMELTNTEDSWNAYAPMEYPLGRGMHLQMEVSDVDKFYNKVIEMKASIFRELETHNYRELDKMLCCKEFLFFDPDGYLLRFSTTTIEPL